MTSSGPDSPAGICKLREAVEAANTLLYHAISAGQDLPSTVRDPIIKARTAVERRQALPEDEEAKFLDAYAKLALRSAPVTAATLDATSRREPGRLGRLFGFRATSDAQRLVWHFGLLAICLIVAIAAGEWTNSFMTSLSVTEKQLGASSQELREAHMRRDGIDDQIAKLTTSGEATRGTANAGAVRQALESRKGEVTVKIWALEQSIRELGDTIKQGYETLERTFFIGRDRFQYTRGPIIIILGGFLLPLLYGALGTCAFVMRSLFREMVDRTFDGRRAGEFTVRIFLGMLSGITLQWLVVRSDGTVAGGMTPAVLAFLGGYSVEMLFTAMDRLVNLVAGRMRSPHRPGQPATRLRREPAAAGHPGSKRIRARELPPNGVAAGHHAASPLTALAAARAEPI